MTAERQQYSLRWNNYFRQLTYALDNHRVNDEFVDVSLLCDGRKIKAHKVVLSACSSYFKDIFTENPHPHPMIIFKFIKYEDLNSIIKFMYQGEVNVQQEALQSFLQTAELLAVHGLNSEDGDKTKPPSTVMNDHNLLKSISSTSSMRDVNVASLVTQNVDILEIVQAQQTSSSATNTHNVATHQVNTATGSTQQQDQSQAKSRLDQMNTPTKLTPNTISVPAATCSNASKKRKANFSDDDTIYTPGALGEQTLGEPGGSSFRETIRMDIPEYILGENNDPLSDSRVTQGNNPGSASSQQTVTQIKSEYEMLTESEIEEKYQHVDNAEITIEMRRLLNPSSTAVQTAVDDTTSCSNIGLTATKGNTPEIHNNASSSPISPIKIRRVTLIPNSENTQLSNTNINDILEKIQNVKEATDSIQKQLNILHGQMKVVAEALAENKVLSTKLLLQTYEDVPIAQKFPIETEEKLIELDKEINPENKNQYVKAMRSLLEPDGVQKNLRRILGDNVSMAYNVEGVHGKKSFKQLKNFYGGLLEAVSMTNSIGPADEHIRKAIQLQKKRIFKNMSIQRNAEKNKLND